MTDTSIEWTLTRRPDGTNAPGYTFNPWWGCTKVSPGCTHCYAESFAKRVGHKVWGVDAERRFFGDSHWNEPVKWNRAAGDWPERRKVFCASMADVFEDGRGLGSQRARVFELIAATPHLDWLLLTKRPQNVRDMVPLRWLDAWPSNAWLGTTCEDQERADERIPHLLAAPAPVRFISAEPLLGPIDFSELIQVPDPSDDRECSCHIAPPCSVCVEPRMLPVVDWIIVGGESGNGARPCETEWIRSIVEQCKTADVACFVKQLGGFPQVRARGADEEPFEPECEWPNGTRFVGGNGPSFAALRNSKGGDPSEWPEYLRVREFPREAVSA